jgi:hypothetical protein
MLKSLLALLVPAHHTVRRPPARLCLEALGERSLPSALSPVPDLGPALVASADHQVPFRLSGAGKGTFVHPPAGAVAAFTFEASGKATHLGNWTNSGFVAFTATGNPLVLSASGTVTFVAANGDELHATISGTFNVLTQVGTATFTWQGGTGRFEGATGSADFVVQNHPGEDPLQFTFDFTTEGTISHAGKN